MTVSNDRGPVKVTVVVPVYNPGDDLDDLITSLLGQSLPDEEYEVVLVDDASTDGTAERLDVLAAAQPMVRVIHHSPNSGWPGTPRNLGMNAARGEYVFFADSDDRLGLEALERMYDYGTAHDSDIVWGRVVGENRYVAPHLFRRNVPEVTLAAGPLFALLTVHKMFRTSFLRSAGLRFPEGRQRLEDHHFVVRAYFAAGTISILADYPCYHWRRLDTAEHISQDLGDPVEYFRAVDQVLDIVEANTDPGAFRDWLLAHWYGGKSLKWFEDGRLSEYSPEYARAVFDAVRALAVRRFPASIDNHLYTGRQTASRLLRADDFRGFVTFVTWLSGLRAVAVADPVVWQDDALHVRLTFALTDDTGAQVRMRRVDGHELFDLPARLGIDLPSPTGDGTRPAAKLGVDADLRNRTSRARRGLSAGPRSQLRYDDQGLAEVCASADLVLGPAAHSVLTANAPIGDVLARVHCAGLTRETRSALPRHLEVTRVVGSRTVTAYATAGYRNLSVRLDPAPTTTRERVQQRARSLVRRVRNVRRG